MAATSDDWVQRFSEDTEQRLALGNGDDEGNMRGEQRSISLLPPMTNASRMLLLPPRKRFDSLHSSSLFPSPTPLPRFSLGPRMKSLVGSGRAVTSSTTSSTVPSSLAPIAADDRASGQFHRNPWMTGLIGLALAVAAGIALLWVPASLTSYAVDRQLDTPLRALVPVATEAAATESGANAFDERLASEIVMLAARQASGCVQGVELKIRLTFWPDGGLSYQVLDAVGGPPSARTCVDAAFFGLRTAAFDGMVQTRLLCLPELSLAVEP